MVKRDYFQLEPPLSLYRYVAIMRPLQPRMSKRRNLAIAAVIWISSSLISCPMLLFFKTEEVRIHTYTGDCNNIFSIFVCVSPFLCPKVPATKQSNSRIVCYSEWPDGQTNFSKQEYLWVSPVRVSVCVCVKGRTHERSLLHSKLHWPVNQKIREPAVVIGLSLPGEMQQLVWMP